MRLNSIRFDSTSIQFPNQMRTKKKLQLLKQT